MNQGYHYNHNAETYYETGDRLGRAMVELLNGMNWVMGETVAHQSVRPTVVVRLRNVTMTPVSIFNDVIGPVMRGPSSSHCAAALRIGRLARELMDGDITEVLVEFDRSGSLPTTHASQGSDMGLFGGLLGWDADDERLPESVREIAEIGIGVRIETVDAGDPHPNTYRLTLKNLREQHSLIAISTGGGMMEVISINGVPLNMDGGYHETLVWLPKGSETHFEADEIIRHELDDCVLWQVRATEFVSTNGLNPIAVKRLSPVLPVPSRQNIEVPFRNCLEMIQRDGEQQTPLWRLALEYERARGNFSEAEVLTKMIEIVRILRKSIESGIAGTQYNDRVLGHQSGRFQELMNRGGLLDGGALNRTVLYVTAM
ncbi:MAG: hypothetical protein B7Z55_16200, partial [Planctomycetales bacterium 12-60-4]